MSWYLDDKRNTCRIAAHTDCRGQCTTIGQLIEGRNGTIAAGSALDGDKPEGPKDFGKDAYAGFLVSRDGVAKTWGNFHRLGTFRRDSHSSVARPARKH